MKAVFLLVVGLSVQSAELRLDSAFAPAGSVVPIIVRFSAAGSRVAAIQFDLDHAPILALTAAPDSAAARAGKDIVTAPIAADQLRSLVVGLNREVLEDGSIVTLTAFVSPSVQAGVYSLRLTNMLASDPEGNPVSLTGIEGSLTVSGAVGPQDSGLFAQLVSGGGWKTIFSLVNPTSVESSVGLTFWDEKGAPLAVPLAHSPELKISPAPSSSVDLVIPPNGTAVVETVFSDSGETLVGSARLRSVPGILSFAALQHRLSETRAAESIVQLEARASASFDLPFDNTDGSVTGVAIANGSDTEPASIAVTIWDAAGKILNVDSLSLLVRGHGFFSLPDRYPALLGVQGSLELRNLNGGILAVLGLRFNPNGTFVTIPVEAH